MKKCYRHGCDQPAAGVIFRLGGFPLQRDVCADHHPYSHSLSPLEAAALQRINQARIVLGHKPLLSIPQGERNGGATCPVANGIPGTVIDQDTIFFCVASRDQVTRLADEWNVGFQPFDEQFEMTLPGDLSQFIKDFDAGRYPKYQSDEAVSA